MINLIQIVEKKKETSLIQHTFEPYSAKWKNKNKNKNEKKGNRSVNKYKSVYGAVPWRRPVA